MLYLEDSFYNDLSSVPWSRAQSLFRDVSRSRVEDALEKEGARTIDDFVALLSDTALEYLEPMARLSGQYTRQRFGNVRNLFIPMYVSNECSNLCTYCGYSVDNPMKRTTLSRDQILKEIEAIKNKGFDHVVILTGESPQKINIEYFKSVLSLAKDHFSHVSFEVQPLEEKEYQILKDEGLDGVYVFQETYREGNYKKYHQKGKKSNFRYRLETPERIGGTGVRKIGLGVLLGLEDARIENFFMARHYLHLKKRYWQTKFCISFPRIKKAANVNDFFSYVSDSQLVQFICAWRIFEPDIELSLSTRETASFRDKLVSLGITSMSAESKTSPGAYANFEESALEQFEVSDNRKVEDIVVALHHNGYEGVFKDWDRVL